MAACQSRPDTPSSSGAHTPTHSSTAPSPSASMITTMWSGLLRRFSSDVVDSHPPNDRSHGPSRFLAHARTEPPAASRDDGINGVFVPDHHRRRHAASPFRPPPLDPIVLNGFRDSTPSTARLLSNALAEEIRILLPERLRIMDHWNLVYSLEQDGASLTSLYQNVADYQGRRVGFVLVVKDNAGGILGAYLSEYPHPAPKYFGNGECFLWRASTLASLPPPPSADTTNLTRSTTVASPIRSTFPNTDGPASSSSSSPDMGESLRFKAFPYSGVNDYCINCESGFLSLGAGDGHYGLWLDDSLDRGRSGRSDTFGNEPLSDQGEKFDILGVELWVLGA